MKLQNKSFKLLLLILIVIISSCSKQQSPSMGSDETRGTREIQRLEACSRVNFNKGVLFYQNMIQLFVCTKWDEEFPHMFESMNKISAASWDHLMAPIDQSFIENRQRRDRFFGNIRELDSKGGLDDLSYVIVALNETNFFDSTKALFTCVDDPSDAVCTGRMGRIPQKKSLKNIIKIIDTSPQNIDNLSQFIKLFVKSLNGHQDELRNEINKFRASPIYIPTRLAFVDSLADKARAGFSEEDREFVSKILLTGDESGEAPWIYRWLQNVKMNRDKFRDLLEFPVLVNPNFVSEFKGIKSAYDDKFSCTIRSSAQTNELLEFDLKSQLFNYANVIKNSDQKRFFDDSSEKVVAMKLSTEICKELESNKYNVNITQALVHFAQFMSEKQNYDLTKFLVSQTTVNDDPNKPFSENIYLADMVTGNIFSTGNAINSIIATTSRDFFPIVFDIMKTFPPESYTSMGELIQSMGHAENDVRIKAVADFWTFFTPEEKNFAFNFIDRHFDKQTNFYLLFDFYTKFLDDMKEVQPVFKEKWMGTAEVEEMSYLTIQDLFSHFSGKETLLDFKKFFSRDQILKFLEVISNGQVINKQAQAELDYIRSDNYIFRSRTEPYKFKVKYQTGSTADYDSKTVIDCMTKFSEVQNGLYYLIRNLPAACSKLTNENIAFRLFGWINSVESNYLEFKKANDSTDSLLDKNGLLSPYMLNTSIGMAKLLDNLVGPLNSTLPTKNGINYFLTSANYHLNQKGAANLIDENLKWMNSFLEVSPEKNIQHRNALVKTFTKDENFDYSRLMFSNLGKLFTNYGEWIKSGELQKAQNRNLGIYDPKNDCEKVINQTISPYPCPNKETIKLYGGDMLSLLQNVWEANQGSPIALMLKAVKTGEGINIPLGGTPTTKFRISLRDTFRYMYDGSDKSFDINNLSVKYVNDSGKTTYEKVTTIERTEAVIREVRFGNSYLGVSFLNAVAHGQNYNSVVAAKKKLLKVCLKIPVIRCSRLMSRDDLRMAQNAMEVFDSLSDINNGRGLDSRMQYGDFFKAFEGTLVGSSALASQKVQLLPLKDSLLVKHNGKILSDMTLLTSWSNAARVIRDRVGRTRKDFDSFIESEDFKRVDRALLYGFDLPQASLAAEHLINKLNKIPTNENQTLFAHSVDWMASLNYSETRLVEDTVARLMLIGSYLGSPEVVFQTKNIDQINPKYNTNNLFQIFLALEKVVDYWPTLRNYFPGDVRLIDAIRPINTALYYLTIKLKSENDPTKNIAYLALNDTFLVLQTVLFDNVPNAQIGGNPKSTTQGLDLLLETFKDTRLVSSFYSVVKDDYHYLDVLHENSGEWFFTVGQNLKRVAQSTKIDLTPIRDYLSFSSRNLVCQSGESTCRPNYHYDEPANLIKYLNKKSDSGISNFMLMNKKVFVENIDQISQMIDNLLPCVKIKEYKAPLGLN